MTIIALLATLLVSGCNLPRDPHATSGKVSGGTLNVGVLVDEDRFAVGGDAATIARIAQEFSATVQLHRDSPDRLITALDNGEIDLLAGGLAEDSPLAAEFGVTRPVGFITLDGERKPRVLGVRKGENGFLLAVNRAIAKMHRLP